MDLSTAANVAEIVGAGAVLAGGAYALAEWRESRRRRVDLAALQLIRSFQTDAWMDAIRVLYRLPDDVPGRDIAADADRERAAVTVASYFSTMGYGVHAGTLPLRVFREFDASTVVLSWRKLRRWVHALRRQNPEVYRWFEWLAVELGGEPYRPVAAGAAAGGAGKA